jgi:diguanylate cyclase (GGDEF)-like protein
MYGEHGGKPPAFVTLGPIPEHGSVPRMNAGMTPATTSRPARDLRRWLTVTAARLAAVFAGYWLAWHISGQFDVAPEISALFLTVGVTASVTMLLGLGWLPVAYVADQVVAGTIDLTGLTALHFLVYGSLGLYLRHAWFLKNRRFSLGVAVRFVALSLAATLANAALEFWVRSWQTLAPPEAKHLFLSFWGGDFAGLMIGLPLILLLRTAVIQYRESGLAWLRGQLLQIQVLAFAGHAAVAFCLALLVAWLPVALDTGIDLHMLMLFPLVLAALAHGAAIGFVVTGIMLATYLLAGQQFGTPMGHPVEVQLMLAVAAAVVLLAGAARDDREHEWRHAHVDALTGVPNRRMLVDRMEQAWQRARRTTGRFAVLCLDLDRFKEINDTLGHDAGDRLLVLVAERMKGCLRAYDTVARTGGDEFVIVLPDLSDPAGAETVAAKILREFERPFESGEHSINASTSIGIAVYPDDGRDPATLQRHADAALYSIKAGARGTFQRWKGG